MYRISGKVVAVIKEATFNAGGTFVNADCIEITEDTNMKPEIASVESKVTTQGFLAKAKIPTKETASGTIGMELIPLGGVAKDINGADLLEVCIGVREPEGLGTGCFIGYSNAGTTPANMIYQAGAAETGTGVLYKLNQVCGSQASLAIKEMYGCSTGDSRALKYTGVVPTSAKFNFPTNDICTISIDAGASGFTSATGETLLVNTVIASTPYVGRSGKFMIDGASKEAKDVSLSIENTVVDREAITSAGVSAKIITKKMIKGTFKTVFEDFSELTKFKNSTEGSLYLELTNGTHKFAIYIPKFRYSAVSIENADGILENSIEFEVNASSEVEPILIGSM